MKIIVMDSANVRIEVLNVPDHMIEEDIEQFLAEHDYSLNNISWMAAPIDFVPVQFHEYGICHSDGEELHFVRQGKLKDFSIYDSVQEVKHREQEELAEKLRLRGEKVDDGYEWHFEGECPIVAAYINLCHFVGRMVKPKVNLVHRCSTFILSNSSPTVTEGI